MRSVLNWSFTSIALLGVTATAVTEIITSAPTVAQVTAPTPEQTPTPEQVPTQEQAPTQNQFPTQEQVPPTNQAPTQNQFQTPNQAPAPAATTFPDVGTDFWAYPFIQTLAQRGVITGFPDGSFRPNQPVQRAEFAAMIQQAFNQNPVRQLPAGGFTDVPADYWGASAIQEAYETGFMSGYPGNLFLPNQQIPKVQAIVALSSGLGLSPTGDPSNILSTYYADATAIPDYGINSVAAATEASIVVNYPDVKVLNPLVALTRAEAAAILYQALVRQGQLQPLPTNVAAANYIVAGTTTATPPTQPSGDIVSLAASSSDFSTLASLLQTSGLADILRQQGPFTIFAPTNQAFAALPPETLERLQKPENREELIKILNYHVVSGQFAANQLSPGELKTVENNPVNIQVDPASNQIVVNNASVIQPNIQASNGVIHAINQVLVPPDVSLGQDQDEGISPGRATRGGRSYIAVGGNIGLGGDSALSEGNFAITSKIGLTNFLSVRPGAIIGDDTLIMVPVTYDFFRRSVDDPLGEGTFPISPFLGAGVSIETSDDADVGLLLTGGVDVPLGSRFTVTGVVNASFLNETDVGLMIGVGYNF